MTEFTGLPMYAIAFDCDGVLTDQGTTTIGQDTDRTWDVTPVQMALCRGFSVTVMTCNVVSYVAARLKDQGLSVYPDETMEYRAWDGGLDGCTVLVTNRKILADLYVDDHAQHWAFGDDPDLIFAGFEVAYDYRTIAYRRYTALQRLYWDRRISAATVQSALTAAQAAALRSYP